MTAGWCVRCGVAYEDARTPQCECAGDPPCPGGGAPFDAFGTHRRKVAKLRPTDTERRSAELGLLSGDATATIAGPAVLAVVGAFLVLLAVIRSTKPPAP